MQPDFAVRQSWRQAQPWRIAIIDTRKLVAGIRSYFGCFDFAHRAWRPANALRISGSPRTQALSIVIRLM
jgi:hypothetical protein